MSSLPLSPIRTLTGRLSVPGDKSISHRYVLLAGASLGTTCLRGLSDGADVRASLDCICTLGAVVDRQGPEVRVTGWGAAGPTAPPAPLECMNSGTTMRLLAGLVSGYDVPVVLVGDASLSRRPMRRVLEPLERMGATVSSADGHAPIAVHGGRLRGIDWTPPVASAQLKSAVMLAALRAEGVTLIHEPHTTRDHTERAFPLFGLEVEREGSAIRVRGGQQPVAPPGVLHVPGDPSSAAIWAAAAAAIPGAAVQIDGVALNPGRLGFIGALERMGASVQIKRTGTLGGEPVGTLSVTHGPRRDTLIEPDEVPSLIDELPVLAASAAHGARLEVRGAGELRVKESDRITALVSGLRALGVTAEEYPDGFRIDGRAGVPAGGTADAAHDHRMVMAFSLVALGATGPTRIDGADVVAVSYPSFVADLRALTQ